MIRFPTTPEAFISDQEQLLGRKLAENESEVTPQLRSASKAINFGIMYGKGAYSLSKDLGIPVKEADTFLKTYLDTFPKVDGYMKDCIAHAKDKGYVETLFGRRRALPAQPLPFAACI